VDYFIIRGNRTTAQLVVQLVLATHELGVQCLPDEQVPALTRQLMDVLLGRLSSLTRLASSSSVVDWFLVLVSRVYLRSETEVAGPVWAVLSGIIGELQRRSGTEPLQQLLQSRFGFYGRPFEAELVFGLSENEAKTGQPSKPVSIAASFAALNELVNASSGDKVQYSNVEQLSLKRSCDLLDVEPLPVSLVSASDGVRLERPDAGNSSFTAVALNGLVEASKLASRQNEEGSGGGVGGTSHRWQHLLGTCPTLQMVMERLHAGGRKFVVLDFGSPVLLTDLLIPACVDWVAVAVDVWNKNETDVLRLTTSSDIHHHPLVLHDIHRCPLVLHDIQPPLIRRYIRVILLFFWFRN